MRRVATLVALGLGVPAGKLFEAVTEEVGRVFSAEYAHLIRYALDDTANVLAAYGRTEGMLPAGTRLKLGGKNVTTLVFETGRSARIDDYADASGPFGIALHEMGVRSAIAAPIIIQDRLWGVVAAGSTLGQPLPVDTETRLASFTELLAMAIANAESRAALAASRGRIVAAADETRRRIERDLHDGAQQRLVQAVIVLKLAQRALSDGYANAGELVTEALSHAEQASAGARPRPQRLDRADRRRRASASPPVCACP